MNSRITLFMFICSSCALECAASEHFGNPYAGRHRAVASSIAASANIQHIDRFVANTTFDALQAVEREPVDDGTLKDEPPSNPPDVDPTDDSMKEFIGWWLSGIVTAIGAIASGIVITGAIRKKIEERRKSRARLHPQPDWKNALINLGTDWTKFNHSIDTVQLSPVDPIQDAILQAWLVERIRSFDPVTSDQFQWREIPADEISFARINEKSASINFKVSAHNVQPLLLRIQKRLSNPTLALSSSKRSIGEAALRLVLHIQKSVADDSNLFAEHGDALRPLQRRIDPEDPTHVIDVVDGQELRNRFPDEELSFPSYFVTFQPFMEAAEDPAKCRHFCGESLDEIRDVAEKYSQLELYVRGVVAKYHWNLQCLWPAIENLIHRL